MTRNRAMRTARRVAVITGLSTSLLFGAGPAESHPFVQSATSDRGYAVSDFAVHSAAVDGTWTFEVLAVTGRPAWAIAQIVEGYPGEWTTIRTVNIKKPQPGDTGSVSLPASDSGTYAVRIYSWGGPPGSGVRVSTQHPGV